MRGFEIPAASRRLSSEASGWRRSDGNPSHVSPANARRSRTLEQMRTVVGSLSRPLNVVMGFAEPSITLAELREIRVRRVSIGGALSSLALGASLDGARQMRAGRFAFVAEMAGVEDLRAAFI